jgi:hypothetical protein
VYVAAAALYPYRTDAGHCPECFCIELGALHSLLSLQQLIKIEFLRMWRHKGKIDKYNRVL